MKEGKINIIYEQNLKICINTLRDILNEMCIAIDEPDTDIKRLNVSCQLDKLIVEYMNLKYNN
ncbi:Spo0E family sporulation regulatory protein-aspartic acid phosphatase [Clostridium psychrophilum]|uniref:Spo0E family sporulation regulatory protein-aspartic acid phosphatase n=1 Tax=Clostridium psychrophilum TaxID=132926 RepID=UPI001C0BB94B|nr:Spo0E family sporulation regulatory protein-aspartic acid phosphatase [Clostridium psychrophilum]MBU3181619.1 Spo0E family sporulation regulatory protein-aspartic acid phosphatase [Clostridium psychrophilum]